MKLWKLPAFVPRPSSDGEPETIQAGPDPAAIINRNRLAYQCPCCTSGGKNCTDLSNLGRLDVNV